MTKDEQDAYVQAHPPMRLFMIHQGLKAETKGWRLTRKAPSCVSICKREFGLKGRTAVQLLPLFEALLARNGVEFKKAETPV